MTANEYRQTIDDGLELVRVNAIALARAKPTKRANSRRVRLLREHWAFVQELREIIGDYAATVTTEEMARGKPKPQRGPKA